MSSLRPGTRPPWAIAHRGASATYPENTVAAFDAALAAGCDGIELDVQLTRDGLPLVYHDRTLRKLGGRGVPIHRVDAAEVARLDAGGWFAPRFAGTRVPTLEAVLRRYGRRTNLLLELKARPRDKAAGVHELLAAAVSRLVRRERLERRVWLLSFDLETLEAVGSRLRTVLNLRAPSRRTRALDAALDAVAALSVDVRSLSPFVVRESHRRDKPVFTYTCNTERAVRRARDCGVDGVMSDRPAWLAERVAGPA